MLSQARRIRTAVLVSGGGTNLQALLDARGSVIRSAELALVISNKPGAYALERARAAGIPALTVSAKTLGGREAFEQELQRALEPFCGKDYYGLRVHEAALARGVKITGATVHFVNEIPDGGEILLQKAVEVLPGDTPELLQRRVMEQAEWVLLPRAVELTAGKLLEQKQEVISKK